ncbi:MAG: LytTR family DNA-binding domain-containing protein, partial [Kangiellaceae bacterium]|nr:LytTR family DNA-binding domain-containing protein [Kangiellaceae bacterium]
FEHEAIDYLLKPIQEKRLEKTLRRIKARLSEEKEPTPSNLKLIEELMGKIHKEDTENKKLTWIKTTRKGDVYLIDPKDVFYFQAEDKYTTVVTSDNEYHIRMSIKELAKQLDSDQFWQIHRSTLVNSKCIEKVNKDFNGRMYAHLKDSNKKLQVSRSFTGIFKQM